MGQPAHHAALTTTTPATKLRPPRVRHTELTRNCILEDDRVAVAEILAISAPAGFGKSTLAIQWASRSEQPIVWLTCDATDADPVVLLGDLQAAFEHGTPTYESGSQPITLDEPAYSRHVVPGFAQSINSLAGPVTVVLDDVHLVTSEQARSLLKTLVDSLPTGSHLALVGRSLHGLPLPLWRGQGRVVDVTDANLSFSAEETAQALAQFTARTFGEDEALQVYEATQGWPVAVYLSAQSTGARNVSSVEEFIEAEVLGTMPMDLRSFVMETAVLGSVNVGLARAATGEPRAAHFLGEAITTVLMQATHDDWYRYHPLLQECATHLLAREEPDRLQVVRAAAALWHLENSHLDQAVPFALAAGDPDTLAAVLWPAARISLLRGRTAGVRAWLAGIGERGLLETPALAMTAAWTSVASGDFGNVLHYTMAALHQMPDDWMADLTTSDIAPHLALLIALTGEGPPGSREAATLAGAARLAMSDDDPAQALAWLIAGLNLALIGDPQAGAAIKRSVAVARAVGIASSEVEALSMLGLMQIGDGAETSGCDSIEQAERTFAFHDLATMTSTSGLLAIARVARTAFRGRESDIRRAIDGLNTSRPALAAVLPWFDPLAVSVLAFVSIRLGDLEEYRHYVDLCEQSAEQYALCRQWVGRARLEYATASPLRDLSPAELRVWNLLRSRMTLSEIADELFLSRETVKTHTVSIYRKLAVNSRREAQDLAESWQ